MKAAYPLFKQQGLSVHRKVKNLTTLISSQLELKVPADMEDLEKAISNASDNGIKDETKRWKLSKKIPQLTKVKR